MLVARPHIAAWSGLLPGCTGPRGGVCLGEQSLPGDRERANDQYADQPDHNGDEDWDDLE